MGTGVKQLPVLISYDPQGPKGDMLKYQSSLPKLPVPTLQQSLQKYLKAVQPLVNDEEFKKTCKAVEEFGMKNGSGEKLQKALEDRAKTRDNWVSFFMFFYLYCILMIKNLADLAVDDQSAKVLSAKLFVVLDFLLYEYSIDYLPMFSLPNIFC